MELKNYSTIVISSILVFVLITVAATGISTISFENVSAQGENMTGMSQDQTSGGGESSTAVNPALLI